MKPIDMILAYAEPNGHRHALSIFACWGISQEGTCECPKGQACTSPGKHPIPSNGSKAATRDVNQIRQWWSAHPNANLGIPTGRANGLLVIDVDDGPEKHGEESLMALEGTLGPLPETWESLTGGGGRHLFFQFPEYLDALKSSVGFEGLMKKGAIFLIVILAAQLDRITGNSAGVFRTSTAFFFIANDALSVLENVGEMGVKLPGFLTSALTKLRDENEGANGGSATDEGDQPLK
jgi:toxin secretion/phage lysis holin